MRRLAPGQSVSAFEVYRLPPGVPHLRALFIRTLNGAATDETGWTDSLGGPADLEVMSAVRAHADAILVGAATIRTARMPPVRKLHREAVPGTRPPQLVVVSQSLDLDWELPVFTESARAPLVVTSAAAARSKPRPPGAPDLITAGDDRVDLPRLMATLQGELNLPRVVCEGGATLINGLLEADLVDELCLTLAPTIVGGQRPGEAALRARRDLSLAEVYSAESVLLLRYRRLRS